MNSDAIFNLSCKKNRRFLKFRRSLLHGKEKNKKVSSVGSFDI